MGQMEVTTVMQDAIMTVLVVAAPILIVGMIVGVIISIFQATTQINEQTLAFVPKIIAILLSILLFGGWMLVNLTEFAGRVYSYAAPLIS
ncbi:MAG: flagellar biosynthesis protein FliQ [Clostridiales bacterium]|jgi:flagellar biosynthetic protein FliQ|nr:flagellar biosynthesis protein FliQ [Clostridiales bacterium]